MTTNHSDGLGALPSHFHREHATLQAAGVHTWEQLADLPRERLRDLASSGVASEARLLRLQAQARLMTAVGLAADEASVLLHAGIGEARALAEADPQRLLVQVNRFYQRLLGRAAPSPTLATVRRWIQAAASSRSAN